MSDLSIFILCRANESGEYPCFPEVFRGYAAAALRADELLQADWLDAELVTDDGDALPYPGNWQEAQEILRVSFSGEHRTVEITGPHTIPAG